MQEAALAGSGSAVPQKHIVENPQLMHDFRHSASFAKIIVYLQRCSEAVEGTPRSARLVQNPAELHPTVHFFLETFFPHLHKIVDEVPLQDMRQQRFGNKAFRVFHQHLEADVNTLMQQLVATLPATTGDGSEGRSCLAVELAEYVKDSFGNSIRIDYGTGHELHFFVVMAICLEECGDTGGTLHAEPDTILPLLFSPPKPVPLDDRDRIRRLRQGMVFEVFSAYLTFMRRLQKHYHLEPAGSHGVWGLDDYHHIPFIFGAAQLIGKEVPCTTDPTSAGKGCGVILPKHVCEENTVRLHADEYFYFAQVAWVRDNKVGPFFEHSSMLYNISGVETWRKIYTGMIKMYAAEVLGKFNVVQHFLFGTHFPWLAAVP
ncbi:protein phosphatase 2A, regulatory subunit B [Trypanosoma rangeli]|uniref:Serine/threonine-protein phosphatase 2A activator n=1 Tax=Trypanosoma rangeli TaxID=5698 RepID=A0A3R7M448_TRYRA|nr:protein phosphatase 2A, regulatory subunit B [Trypanosoma rangeli]RNF08676.1 protein phosphatase 2A, regulatory subunit B [Trypanosoma rangeli]|eukprot:RNF08676.1 protein phosphatase 2A, regulatory subunit B [Trypanosoma rangeli]